MEKNKNRNEASPIAAAKPNDVSAVEPATQMPQMTQMPQTTQMPQMSCMPPTAQMPQMTYTPQTQYMPQFAQTPAVCCPYLMNMQCPMMNYPDYTSMYQGMMGSCTPGQYPSNAGMMNAGMMNSGMMNPGMMNPGMNSQGMQFTNPMMGTLY